MINRADEPRFLYIISTGRCGTQWLARALGEIYADHAIVTHEPLGPAYQPKETLRSPERLNRLAARPPLAGHLAYIDGTLELKPYIECGWPAFAAVPLFIDRYGPRLRLIHLLRHPVHTALSYQTVNHYQLMSGDPWLPCELDPFDEGILHRQYRAEWDKLSAYEKSLFQWLEIHSWAESIKTAYPQVPLKTVCMEDLFSTHGGAVLDEIIDMAGLPHRPALHALLSRQVDAVHEGTERKFDWQQIHRHPEVLALASHYGYSLDNLETDVLRQRYKAPFLRRVRKRFIQFRRRLKHILRGKESH